MTGTGLAVVRNTAIAPALSFGDMMDMGEQLVRTGFLPAHLRTGAQVAAVILTGRELGMEPMRAVRSLSLVKGKVVEAADSQLARFKADGGRATFKSLTEMEAVLWLRHPNGDEHTESFTMQDARNAGLASNDNYKKFPKAMLRSRVITAALKSVGWEGAVGNYDPDELAVSGSAAVGPAEYAHTEPVEPAQLGDALATDKQRQFLGNLLRSSVFTDAEREKIQKRASTKEKAKAAIEYVQTQITERKAALAEDETDGPDVELLDGSAPILDGVAA
jgi:hypothetical protein